MCENELKEQAVYSLEKMTEIVDGYIYHEFCQADAGARDKEPELTQEELDLKRKESKKAKEEYRKKHEALYKYLSKNNIQGMMLYVDSLIDLYHKEDAPKREIKKYLTDSKSLKLFRQWKKNLIEIYPILVKINDCFPIDEYSEFSLKPYAYLYGSLVNKTHNSSSCKIPSTNEEIQNMLELFLSVGDNNRFNCWIDAILFFDKEKIVESCKSEFIPQREELKRWVCNQFITVDAYKNAAIELLFTENRFQDLSKTAQLVIQLKKEIAAKDIRIKEISEEKKQEIAAISDTLQNERAKICAQETEITKLREQLILFGKCKEQLTYTLEKYQAQITINEQITVESNRRIQEINEELQRKTSIMSTACSDLQTCKDRIVALESDLVLKNSELMRLQDTLSKSDESTKSRILRELISALNDQLYYLSMFLIELRETGGLEPQSIELFGDTLNSIDTSLEKLGVKKLGVLDQIVSYDASMHDASGVKIFNGDNVVVQGFGWSIGGNVFIKVPVEKTSDIKGE